MPLFGVLCVVGKEDWVSGYVSEPASNAPHAFLLPWSSTEAASGATRRGLGQAEGLSCLGVVVVAGGCLGKGPAAALVPGAAEGTKAWVWRRRHEEQRSSPTVIESHRILSRALCVVCVFAWMRRRGVALACHPALKHTHTHSPHASETRRHAGITEIANSAAQRQHSFPTTAPHPPTHPHLPRPSHNATMD